MKKWIFCLLLIVISSFATEAMGQTYTQTYKDKCTGEIKVATTTMTNGFATVSFYNQVRVFSPQEVMAGAVQLWILQLILHIQRWDVQLIRLYNKR